ATILIVDEQSHARPDPRRLGILGQHRLKVRAHSNRSHLATIFAARHDVLEKTCACSPDVARPATEFFESSTYDGVRSKSIENRFVVRLVILKNDLRQYAFVVF